MGRIVSVLGTLPRPIPPPGPVVGVLAALFAGFLALAQTPDAEHRLKGTFLQLTNAQATWQTDNWVQLFDYFRELRLSELFVQWSLHDQTAFYASSAFKPVTTPPLELLMTLADQRSLQIWIGLAHDPQFWEKVNNDSASVKGYLRVQRERSLLVARELAAVVQSHPSFAGWYVTEEIDDLNWRPLEARDVLFDYLGGLTTSLRQITGNKVPIAVSSFSNAALDPVAFEKFWSTLLARAPIDVVLFQDGIGAAKLDLEHLPLYLASMRRAVDQTSRSLRVVVEVFEQVDGLPINDKPFRAIPAPLDRIDQQSQIAARYATHGLIAFSVPEYLTPIGGMEAATLFSRYVARLPKSP
jgi:hypothetical protein